MLYEVKENIATITVNRPDKMNALNSRLVDDITGLLEEINENTEIRAVVIKGAKCKAFIAGADIGELHQMKDTFEFRRYYQKNVHMADVMMNMDQPVIVAIDGYAFGGGTALSLSADFVICTDRSKFGTMEVNVGFPGNGSMLTKLVGKQKAAELTMLGSEFDAQEAYRMMLVNKIVKPEELNSAVEDLCSQIKQKSYYAVKMAKRVIYITLNSGLAAAGAYESDASAVCFLTEDCQNLIDNFVNKK